MAISPRNSTSSLPRRDADRIADRPAGRAAPHGTAKSHHVARQAPAARCWIPRRPKTASLLASHHRGTLRVLIGHQGDSERQRRIVHDARRASVYGPGSETSKLDFMARGTVDIEQHQCMAIGEPGASVTCQPRHLLRRWHRQWISGRGSAASSRLKWIHAGRAAIRPATERVRR